MGNCLKGTASDDVSLLRGGEGTRESSSSEQIHGSDVYTQVIIYILWKMHCFRGLCHIRCSTFSGIDSAYVLSLAKCSSPSNSVD